MSVAPQSWARLGPTNLIVPWNVNPTTFVMAALNTGYAVRHWAYTTQDVKALYLNFSAVTAPGTLQCRIETVDATTGKPTGTLYDANATRDFTPAVGWNLVSFSTLPTAGRVIGVEYALVLLTTLAGTTQTLRAYYNTGIAMRLPGIGMTAADASTRSNFAEVNGSVPLAVIVYEDDTAEPLFVGIDAISSSQQVFGINRHGATITLNAAIVVRGFWGLFSASTGAPSNLRAKLLNSSNAVEQGLDFTIDKDSLTLLGTGRQCEIPFAPVTLAAGTYHLLFHQLDTTTTSANRYNLSTGVTPVANLYAGSVATTTTDEVLFTDTETAINACGLVLHDLVAGGGGGGILAQSLIAGGS